MVPHWLWLTTPFKFWAWLSSRVTTAFGSFMIWKRHRTKKQLWVQIVVLNLLSWGALILLFLWLYRKFGT